MTSVSDWVWMPHPGHFICAQDCKFHLNTYVNGYIVSTVGEFLPDSSVREIFAESRGIKLKGKGDERKHDYLKKIGFEEIGCERKYETMVFTGKKAEVSPCSSCCPYIVDEYRELDMKGYNDPGKAYRGHIEMCKKWSMTPSLS